VTANTVAADPERIALLPFGATHLSDDLPERQTFAEPSDAKKTV